MIKILIGIISGIVSGMGMGGGSILITILTCFLGVDQKIAQSTNIVFFIPTSVAATIINIKNKKVRWKIAIPLTLSGIVGAIIGSNVALNMETKILRKIFAVFLLVIAIYETIYWYRKYIKRHNKF